MKQPPYVKIRVLGRRNARDSHADLCEALGVRTLLYRTVARCVQEFKSGRVFTAAMHRSGPCVSVHTDVSVFVFEQSMDEDRRWSVKELADETAICGSRVLRTLTQDFRLHRIAAKGCHIIWGATVDALRDVLIWNVFVAKGEHVRSGKCDR